MTKDKWIPVYDGDGKHVATVNVAGEMRSLGPSNDKGTAVRDEMRAAELQHVHHETAGEYAGYAAHFYGHDVPRGGWAGWLEREMSTDDELCDSEAPAWQAKVHAECDKIDEQTRHDVAQSVVRHDALPADPHADFTARFQTEHDDEEPTQVGAVVDGRFDRSEP